MKFVQYTEMSISQEPFELHPWFFAENKTLQWKIRKKNWGWVQPAQPTYQTKKWKSRITFECLFRFGWFFCMKVLGKDRHHWYQRELGRKIFTALPNQPKLVLIEIFWKFLKFRVFSLKHPQPIAFKHNLKKNIVILILSLP